MSPDSKIRYRTSGGALVVLIPLPDYRGEWACWGCLTGSHHPKSMATAREEANAHANDCRALPRD
jgi:hypothetical protein